MLPISVCIIAKNEEQHIEECCKRLAPYGFEIVLADTGSTDRTVELARKYTDKIYLFDWCDDFSAARNYAMQKASHDWILSLDCDEYVEVLDIEKLRDCMRQYPRAAGRILIRNRFTENGQTSYEQVRVSRFVNRRCYHFEGAVHEQLTPKAVQESMPKAMCDPASGAMSDSLPESTTQSASTSVSPCHGNDCHDDDTALRKYVYPAPVTVLHVGYDGTKEELREKSRRNIALLEKELETQGADPYLYYQLGQSYRKLHNYERALHYYDLGLAMDVDPALDYVQTMVESYGYTLLDLHRAGDALNLLGVYDAFAKRADFVFLMGLVYMNNGRFDEAVHEFQKATTMEEFAVDGVNSYKANYNIGVIYECTGYTKEAIDAYRRCGDYEAAQIRLSQLENK